MGKFLRDNATLLALVALIVTLAIMTDNFLTARNFTNITLQVTNIGIVAVGMTMVILIAGIDLSVGSLVGLAAIAVTWLMQSGTPVWAAVFITLLGGAAVGLWNGFWIAHYKIPAFIITLGMMTIARGLALSISGGTSIPAMDQGFTSIGGEFISKDVSRTVLILLWAFFVWRTINDIRQRRKYSLPVNPIEKGIELFLVTGGVGLAWFAFVEYRGIPIPAAIFAVVALWGAFTLRNTRFGRRLYAMGGNEEAARLSGINVRATGMAVYVIIAVLSGLVGIVLASRLGGASPNLGTMLELDVIAAVVIGGTSLAGGIGTIGGTVIGAFLIGVFENGMSFLDVNEFYRLIVKGFIIIVAVWFDVVSKRKKA